ncbi:MAG: hypothetical protein ACREE6_17135, partial [Limisphaerales bacterium]
GHKNNIIRVRAGKVRERSARRIQAPFQLARQKLNRLALETPPPLLLGGQNGERTGAKGAVVQKGGFGIQ